MTPDQPQTATKSHGLVIGLVFALLLLTLIGVGAVILTNRNVPSSEEYAAACKSQVESAVLDGAREITRACTVTEVQATENVPAPGNGIGFDYPADWSVTINPTAAERVTWRASLVPGYFYFCEGCDGPFIDISMQAGSLSDGAIAAQADFNAYLLTIYTASNGFSEVAIKQAADGSGTRYNVSGQLTGLYEGPFETIYYEGTTNWASAFFLDRDVEDTVSNKGWEIVKGSLDFSNID
jgi:hypothetical protein